MEEMKLGARNSAKDKERIAVIKDAAALITNTADELQPESDEQEPVKGNLSTVIPEFHIIGETLVKAAGDMELDVLLVPFGGPDNGRDTDGQYFTDKTDTQHEIYKSVPAYYYHGFDPNGKPQGDPEIIGMMHYHHTDAKGHWYRAVLDKANKYARRIWEAAKNGLARASSGTIGHIARAASDGFIKLWPVVEGSLIDEGDNRHPANAYAVALPVLKARQPNLVIPSEMEEGGDAEPTEAGYPALTNNAAIDNQNNSNRSMKMEDKDILKLVADEVAKVEAAKAEEAKKAAELQTEIDKAVKAKEEELEKKYAESNRLPTGVYIKKYADTDQFDTLDAADTAVLIGVLKSANKPVSEGAFKALSLKLDEDKSAIGDHGRKAMKAAGIKAGEIDYSTSSDYGDQWVGVAYSTALWNSIRVGSFVVSKIPSIEFPRGVESMQMHLESTDPVWYNIAENTTNGSSVGAPAPTITSSRLATGKASLTLGKLAARVVYTGELEESSVIPFAGQLREQLAVSGDEYLESAIIDGDTETTDSTNINQIGGAEVTGGHYLIFDGFRKSCLVTTTANSRAGGALTVDDFLETLKLMGGAGINALDNSKVSFIIDPNVNWKALALPEVLTRDVYSGATIESGKLARIFGYDVNVSGSMHFMSSVRKANSAGKVDTTTPTNNAYGAILAVRWDQWKLGWMRHIKMESTRFANSDSTEIVAMMRVGLKQRDTEASAITYGVTV